MFLDVFAVDIFLFQGFRHLRSVSIQVFPGTPISGFGVVGDSGWEDFEDGAIIVFYSWRIQLIQRLRIATMFLVLLFAHVFLFP